MVLTAISANKTEHRGKTSAIGLEGLILVTAAAPEELECLVESSNPPLRSDRSCSFGSEL